MELTLRMVAFTVDVLDGVVQVSASDGVDVVTHGLASSEARELADGLYHAANENDRATHDAR